MGARLVLSIRDNGAEIGTVTLPGISMGAANFDAQVALQVALQTAIADLSLGTIYKQMRVASEAIVGLSLPAKGVQREDKWLVRYHDNVTGQQLRLEIPCYDSSLLIDGKETIDKTTAEYIAFKAAFEAYVVHEVEPGNDNAVVVDDLVFMTRRT